MADVSAGALRFDITADNSQFMSAMQKTQQSAAQAADTMGKKFEEASQAGERGFAQMFERAIKSVAEFAAKMRNIDKVINDSVEAGAEATGKSMADSIGAGYKKGFDSIYDQFNNWLKKKGPIGQSASAVLDAVEFLGGKAALEESSKKAAALSLSAFAENFKFEKYSAQFRDGLVQSLTSAKAVVFFDPEQLSKEQQAIKEFADGVKKKIDDMVDGIRIALRWLAGTWDGIRDSVKAALDAMSKRTDAIEFQTSLLGLSPKQKAEAEAKRRFLEESGKALDDLNLKEREAYDQEVERAGIARELQDKKQKEIEEAKRYEQAIISVTAALKRQGDTALANAGLNRGKSAYERAYERGSAMVEGYGGGRSKDLLDNAKVQADLAEMARKSQDATNEAMNLRMAQTIKEQSAAFDLQTRSLGVSAGAAEEMKIKQQLLNEAERQGVEKTTAFYNSVDATASALGRAAQQAAVTKEAFEGFRQVGQTVASSLENAFSQWIGGTQMKWNEFITGLQADLAKLAFKRGIESLITGSAASGGGIMGSLFNLLGFGGFKAEGGAVGGGTPYIVGERGPELFVPQGAGTIVPNHAMGGGGNTTIAMSIDLKGANGDETIARISAMAARQAAVAAIEQANQGFPGRSRSYQLLEG